MLRPAVAGDVPFIASVIRANATLYDPILPGGFGTWADKVEAEGIPDLYDTRVIGVDGTDIGFVSVVWGSGSTYLSSLFLLPERRRGGVGSGVLGRIEDEARGRGHTEVCLLVHREAAWARPFYARHGYGFVTDVEDTVRQYLGRFGPVPFIPGSEYWRKIVVLPV